MKSAREIAASFLTFIPRYEFDVDSHIAALADEINSYADSKIEEAAKEIEKLENRTVGLADAVQADYAKMIRSLKSSGPGDKK